MTDKLTKTAPARNERNGWIRVEETEPIKHWHYPIGGRWVLLLLQPHTKGWPRIGWKTAGRSWNVITLNGIKKYHDKDILAWQPLPEPMEVDNELLS